MNPIILGSYRCTSMNAAAAPSSSVSVSFTPVSGNNTPFQLTMTGAEAGPLIGKTFTLTATEEE